MNRDSIGNTIVVTVSLCLVCSALVSLTAVGLRKSQQVNKARDIQKNILAVAGLLDEGSDPDALFADRIEDRIIVLESGLDVTSEYGGNPSSYDQLEAAASKDDKKSRQLTNAEDIATLKRQERRSHVYVVNTSKDDPTPLMYVFPIRGYGLWGTLFGFIALDADLKTVRGITYYQHKETPGLGGEVDNVDWKNHWIDRQLRSDSGEVTIRLVKADWESEPNTVDALSGATVTSRGVENMLRYWMGPDGFGPFLEQLKKPATQLQSNNRDSSTGVFDG